jgi:hypothetical protein
MAEMINNIFNCILALCGGLLFAGLMLVVLYAVVIL